MFKTALMGCAALLWAGSAQAATWIEIIAVAPFTGWSSDQTTDVDIFKPVFGASTISIVLDLDDPLNFGPGYERTSSLHIDGDTLKASYTEIGGHGELSGATLSLIFAPGVLADGLPPKLRFSDLISGSYGFDVKAHLGLSVEGVGTVTGLYTRAADPTRTGYGEMQFTDRVAVPEPATWLMMIAGFGLVGAAMRRRRAPAIA